MTWPVAFIAALKRRLLCALPVPDPRSRPTCATNTCHTAPRTKPKPLPAAMPDLALREKLSSQWVAARNRRDTVGMHRLESQHRKLVNAILSKGVCSNE